MSSTSNGCEKPTYEPVRMEQQVSMVSRPRTMRRTSRQTFGTSWSASNPGTIKRHRYAEPTSPSLTVRNGHSEFQPSKTRWHREQSLWYWRLFMSRTFCHAHTASGQGDLASSAEPTIRRHYGAQTALGA